MLEYRNEWIVTEALFKAENSVDYKELGIENLEKTEELDALPIRFKLSELIAYNKATENRPTTIVLSSGDSYSLNIEFEEFDTFIQKQNERGKI